jgi:hypothetical protein
MCGAVGHRINRRRVWNDCVDFRTNCSRCGAPLVRDNVGWRAFDSARDENPHRVANPHGTLD